MSEIVTSEPPVFSRERQTLERDRARENALACRNQAAALLTQAANYDGAAALAEHYLAELDKEAAKETADAATALASPAQ